MAVLGNLLPRLVFLLLLFVSSRAKVVTIDVQEAKNLIQAGYIYLDVRTVEEFVKGHVDAAKIINIPYLLGAPKSRVKNQDFLKDVSSACNKEDPLIVGCQIGVRSLNASIDLLADGFKNVKNMEGGYVEWVRNNFPVNTSVVVKEEL
ncbi:thiosulfate sulfurtransferase 18-like isoform X1 [Cicer arietinum]|uniref:Thiosulfate sulfurtransferase 18-like isoform X1 n=1 Tax=Cicer arietinum TaxID=3827 RepID=A0A1S2YYZ6_CICAR|nr:thiosulfate sulfurtransferase 18-like isoform X1 [Cicer arietinum]